MDFTRFITLLLKDDNNTLTCEEWIEWHEMLHQYFSKVYNHPG